MRHSGLPLAIAGSHANNTPRQTPVRTKRRLLRHEQPIFRVFRRGGLHFGHRTPHTQTPIGGIALHEAPTRRRHAARGLHVVQNPRRFLHVGRHLNCDMRLPCRHTPQNSPGTTPPPLTREKTRPIPPLQPRFREKVRPARHKPPILGHFSHAGRNFSRSHPRSDRAGRTFSRTGSCDVTTLKPTTPLQPLMQTNVKPPSPMQPKTPPKTPISHPQRRRRFHAKSPRHPHVATIPLTRKLARNSSEATHQQHPETLKYQRLRFKT